MKNLLTLLTLFLTLAFGAMGQSGQTPRDNAYNSVTYRSLPPLRVGGAEGVSAPFAGSLGPNLIVAGGCNFPDVPAARGGQKRFYSDIYELPHAAQASNEEWHKIGQLPRPLAYGVSVTVSHGVVCVGGTSDGKKSSALAYLLHTDRHHRLLVDSLPSLPKALDNMAGAFGGGYIYVAGGLSDGKTTNAAYRLRYPGGRRWERLPDFPGRPRVQPAAAVQNGATTQCFYLAGGFAPSTDAERAVAHTDALCYNPQTRQWTRTVPITPEGREPLTLAGAFATTSGCAHIVFVGGVNKERFEAAVNRPQQIAEAELAYEKYRTQAALAYLDSLRTEAASYMLYPAEWYRFNAELVIYHTITDTWVTESHSPLLARAGAAFIPCGKEWIVVGGETKPGNVRHRSRPSICRCVRVSARSTGQCSWPTSWQWCSWATTSCVAAAMPMISLRAVDAYPGGQQALAFMPQCSLPSPTWLILPRLMPRTGRITRCS